MKLLHIAFSTIFASVTSLTLSPAASAINWSVSGTFNDNGTISGTFDFDGIDTYSNLNLTTTPGDTSLTSGNAYTNVDVNSDFSNDLGLTLETSDFSFLLDLSFDSSLAGISTPTTINLSTSSTEDDFNLGEQRIITSGTVSTSVPFEFSPTVGLLLAGSIGGILSWKKRRNFD